MSMSYIDLKRTFKSAMIYMRKAKYSRVFSEI